MLEINERNVNLLSCVLKDEEVSLKQLEEKLDLSSKTIQKEINNINHYFHSSHRAITINNQSNIISITYEGEIGCSQKQQLRNEINTLSDIPHLQKVNTRILDMIWYLLRDEGYVRSENLIEQFAISNSTLTASLRQIRQIFVKYDLYIDSTPYYGMQVRGPKISRIACLLDYCDLYSEQENLFFESMAKKYFEQSFHQVSNKHRIVHAMNKELHLNLNEDGFQMINRVIPIIEFLKDVEDDSFECNWINPIFHDEVIRFIHENESLETIISTEQEVLYLLIFILMYHDISLGKEKLITEKFSTDCHVILKYLDKQVYDQTGVSLIGNQQIEDIVISTIIRITMNTRYQIKRYHASNQALEMIQSFPGSKALALSIIYQLYPNSGDSIISDLIFALYNVILKVPNHYEETSALLINRFNNLAVNSVIEKLALDKYNVSYTIVSPSEIFTQDLKQFDYIFNIGDQLVTLGAEQDKVFEIPYLVEAESKKKVWEQLAIKQRSQQFLEDRYQVACIEKVKELKNNVLSKILFDSLMEINLYTELDYIKLMVKYAFSNTTNHETLLLMFDARVEEKLNLKYIIVDEKNMSHYVHIMILPVFNKLTIIKQSDSIVRRIQSGEISIVSK